MPLDTRRLACKCWQGQPVSEGIDKTKNKDGLAAYLICRVSAVDRNLKLGLCVNAASRNVLDTTVAVRKKDRA
jgi:hypothetical protein